MKNWKLFQIKETFLKFYKKLVEKKSHMKNIADDILKTSLEILIFQSFPFRSQRQWINKSWQLESLTDMDDWSVDDEIYEYYEKVWEIYTVNRFATKYKKNCVSIIKNIGVLILNAQMLLMQAGRRSIIGLFLPQI